MKNYMRFAALIALLAGTFLFANTSMADEVVPQEATIIATAIVCPNEANLPNYGLGGPDMASDTVLNFLALHTNCTLAAGFQFQYDTTQTPNPGDNYVGEVPSPWITTVPTDTNGQVVFTVPIDGVSQITVREVFQSGYIGFTHGDASDNSLSYTAEFYCAEDVMNYDNFDYITAPAHGATYHCVAWNAPVRTYPAFCGDGIVNQPWEMCDGGESCTQQCQTESQMCTDNIFGRVIVMNTANRGNGDASDVMYVGGVSQPDFAWFPIRIGGTTIVDPDMSSYENVPGIAVGRSLSSIRIQLYGNHTDGSQEHSEGVLEFSTGATPTVVQNDGGENTDNGVSSIDPNEDEVSIVGNSSHYWFTVTEDQDAYITQYDAPLCQVEHNENGGGGAGGGNGGGGAAVPACADGSDNDSDGKADFPFDLGCESSLDTDESGDGSPSTNNSGTGGGAGNGLGTSTGEVLGATTGEPALPPSCSAYISEYMKFGKKNNQEEVKKLQEFLNEKMNLNIPVTGYFGTLTREAVKKFQKEHHKDILQPWLDAGWKGRDLENGTGYVFKTTKRWINLMKCQSLDLPLPDLR